MTISQAPLQRWKASLVNRKHALRQLSACIGGTIPPEADWRAIVSLANEHLVTPALWEGIAASPHAGPPVPADVAAFLADVHGRSHTRNRSLASTLHDALGALNAAGIVPVLLKGCALWTSSAASGSRIVCDLDLLVRPAEMEHALAALRARGFAIADDQRGRAYHPVVELSRPTDAGSIDLHQHAPGAAHLPALDDIHAHCRSIVVASANAMLPSRELQILLLVLHDQFLDGHFWRGGFHLRHLLDIAVLARIPPEIDWRALLGMCPTPLVRSALRSELLAARRLAGAKVPDWVAGGLWARLNFARHRLFFERPGMATALRSLGLNARVWRALSS
jgi:Uncharacterised nucleotidyltransferase